MKIKELANKEWRICSPIVTKDGFSEVEVYIQENHSDKGLVSVIAAIERLSIHGSRGFTDSSVHEVNKENSIFQLRKGNHRFLYFYGEERKLILMACPHRKSGNKVNTKQVSAAINFKQDYMQQNEAGTIVFCIDK